MNNKDIPESEINERVAEMQDWADSQDYPPYSYLPPSYITIQEDDCAHVHYMIDEFDPLTNHNQYHEIMTPDMEAKVCDVLDGWLTDGEGLHYDDMWWHHPEYQINPRLWKLRAVCEVLNNADTQ